MLAFWLGWEIRGGPTHPWDGRVWRYRMAPCPHGRDGAARPCHQSSFLLFHQGAGAGLELVSIFTRWAAPAPEALSPCRALCGNARSEETSHRSDSAHSPAGGCAQGRRPGLVPTGVLTLKARLIWPTQWLGPGPFPVPQPLQAPACHCLATTGSSAATSLAVPSGSLAFSASPELLGAGCKLGIPSWEIRGSGSRGMGCSRVSLLARPCSPLGTARSRPCHGWLPAPALHRSRCRVWVPFSSPKFFSSPKCVFTMITLLLGEHQHFFVTLSDMFFFPQLGKSKRKNIVLNQHFGMKYFSFRNVSLKETNSF